MEAILYSQNSWNMVGTFYMWRWISCCFLELWGYVCRYRSQSVDLRSYKYPSMRLCCCLCTQVHRCSCSVTFLSSDRCTLWCVLFATLSGEKDKPVLDIRGMLWIYYASQTTTVALPVFTSLSLVCFELFIFFFFFLENIDHRIRDQLACLTTHCHSLFHLFQRQPCLLPFASVSLLYACILSLSFKELLCISLLSHNQILHNQSLIRTTFSLSLDCLSVRKAASASQSKQFQKSLWIICMSDCSCGSVCLHGWGF